jgi:hypothetical protein
LRTIAGARESRCNVSEWGNRKLRILALAHIQWVAIAVNPIASIDRKDLFDRLCAPSLQAHLLKLIWVPEAWLPAGNWKALVRDASLHVRVEAQHKAFYATHSDV